MRIADASYPATRLQSCTLHGPCSAYAWTFYLPLVGLDAMGCYCYLASLVEQGCTEVNWQDIAQLLGMPGRDRVVDALVALESTGMVEFSEGVCGVRRRLPVLDTVFEAQLPPRRRRIHAQARALLPATNSKNPAVTAASPVETMRQKARSEAISLLRMGRSCDDVEVELAARGFHPSLVASSALWALWHLVVTASDRLPFPSTLREVAVERAELRVVRTLRAIAKPKSAPVE